MDFDVGELELMGWKVCVQSLLFSARTMASARASELQVVTIKSSGIRNLDQSLGSVLDWDVEGYTVHCISL